MINYTLNDPTQQMLLPHLEITEELLSRVATKLSGQKMYAEKSAPYNADRCIVASFRRICSQSASQRQNFDAFVKNYGAVLPVTSLAVETVGIKDNKKLMKCSWISSGRENYVLAVCGEKEDL